MFELQYRKLNSEEINQALTEHPEWSIADGQLSREFQFESYLEGINFSSQVGHIAEDLNHHPDILVTWCKVKISVNTHDVGGISPYDFELARRIESIR